LLMVLESLINPGMVKRNPWYMMLIGFTHSVVGVLLSLLVFPTNPSLPAVFLTTMAILPFMVNYIKSEEAEDVDEPHRGLFHSIKKHYDIMLAFVFLFFGMLVAFTLWDLLYPEEVFMDQVNTIRQIRSGFQGTGSSFNSEYFIGILMNNLRVTGLCVLFSFLFGAGAIFILTWNASVIGVAISDVIKKVLLSLSPGLGSWLHAVNIGFSTYVFHGTLELLAYFVAALGGGIISVGVIRHKVNSKAFKNALLDSIDLIVLSLVILVIAAFVEVSI